MDWSNYNIALYKPSQASVCISQLSQTMNCFDLLAYLFEIMSQVPGALICNLNIVLLL